MTDNTLDLSEKLKEKKKVIELQAQLEKLLEERPEYREFQKRVEKELEKAGNPEDIHIPHDISEHDRLKLEERKRLIHVNRMSFIGSMMFESFNKMIDGLKVLQKEVNKLPKE